MSGSQIASGFASKSDHGGSMTVPWPDNSGASGVLQICSPHVLLSRRADSSDYALDPAASWSKGPKRDCCPIC